MARDVQPLLCDAVQSPSVVDVLALGPALGPTTPRRARPLLTNRIRAPSPTGSDPGTNKKSSDKVAVAGCVMTWHRMGRPHRVLGGRSTCAHAVGGGRCGGSVAGGFDSGSGEGVPGLVSQVRREQLLFLIRRHWRVAQVVVGSFWQMQG